MADRTPVTLLTGVPGAARTGLLDRLLHEPGSARTLVLRAGTGAMPLAGVLRAGTGAMPLAHPFVVALAGGAGLGSGGCPCCRGQGGMLHALRQWLPRARRGEIDRVVVETAADADPARPAAAPTADADPARLAADLAADIAVAAWYRLAAVVAVLDAATALDWLATPAGAAQVAAADRIVIVGGNASPALSDRLRAINPRTAILAGSVTAEDAFSEA
jgi:G3E family GTPase